MPRYGMSHSKIGHSNLRPGSKELIDSILSSFSKMGLWKREGGSTSVKLVAPVLTHEAKFYRGYGHTWERKG